MTPEYENRYNRRNASPTRWFLILILVAVGAAFFIFNHFWPSEKPGGVMQAEKAGTAKRPVPVITTLATEQTLPLETQVIGNVEALSSVSVKSQISGKVLRINFKEGDYVSGGQLLFTIDPSPFEAQLLQAQAQVVQDTKAVGQAEATAQKDQAQLNFARGQEQRYSQLYKQEFVTREQFEQVSTNTQAAAATLAADKAAIETAKAAVKKSQAAVTAAQVQLNYCYIHAPFSGRTGNFLVHAGDSVSANATSMVNIDKLSPIYVSFSIPEPVFQQVQQSEKKGQLHVTAKLSKTSQESFEGKVSFIDNTVDPVTGTIKLKGLFANPGHKLWPGQFVQVLLSLGEMPDTVVVPAVAVQSGQKGDYVFVNKNGIAELRPVVVSRVVNNMAAIASGLNAGESVVTDGQFQLAPDFHLKVKRGL